MASTILSDNGVTSGSAGLKTTAASDGALALQTTTTGGAATTALTIDTSQNITLAGTLTTTGITNSGVATATRFNPTGSSVTGNGMYLPAANSLGLSTNGTNAVYIDSSQNVGIGTASPTQKLTVSGSSSLGTASASGNTQIFQAPGSLFLTMNTNGTLSGARRNWAISPEYDVAGGLSFSVGTSEGAVPSSPRLIIKQQGAVILSGGSTSADGTGITFPATQSASSDANTLDDYEEGTFTPTLTDGTNSVSTYSVRTGNYVKVGNIVTVVIEITVSNKGSISASMLITGLPFTTSKTGFQGAGLAQTSWSSLSGTLTGGIYGGNIYLYNQAAGGQTNLSGSTNLTNTSQFGLSITYTL